MTITRDNRQPMQSNLTPLKGSQPLIQKAFGLWVKQDVALAVLRVLILSKKLLMTSELPDQQEQN